MADLMPLPRTGPGSGPAMTAQLIHQSTTLWNSSLWPSGAVTVASSMPQQQQSSPAARAQRPARVAPPPEPIDDGLMPVADAEVDSGRTVVEVTGYSSIDVMGYGQVNGYEFIFAGGGRLCYGVCKGRREALALKDGECIIRIAGRIDRGRRHKGTSRHAPKVCLVSLMFTTSKAREVVFGLAHKTRADDTFSFFAEYRSEIVGVRTLAWDLPIVTAPITQPRRLSSVATSLPPLPLVASGHIGAGGEHRAAPRTTHDTDATGLARGGAHMRAVVGAVESMERRVRFLRPASLDSVCLTEVAPPERPPSVPPSEDPAVDDGRWASAPREVDTEWQSLEAEQILVRQHLDALLELQTCKVCLDQSIGGVLVPCGHLCLCLDCAARMKVGSACPICRVPATAFSLTYSA